ncbi:uncharacterized protein LOC107366294 [Tetranychus urticae]|uniref:F-box domain-containing protein n=1 Tax=Tetranychus urticae TaxID=32264 RepID=T1JRU2_TETUR|nr:uncharacterized protein LOC107366294 [Tetranychus urticae]
MFINELPDDCLLIIFDLINELDDLLNCFKVCSKWSHLIADRTRKVKYLIEHQDWRNDEPCLSYPFDWVYFRTGEPIDGTCLSSLFPNLMVADFSDTFRERVKHEDIVTLIKKIKPLKGLFNPIHSDTGTVFKYCNELEMVLLKHIEPCIEKNGFNIKQLVLWNSLTIFKNHAHYFPNLERLYINNQVKPDGPYDGPISRRLKILEICSTCYDGRTRYTFYGFQFMDYCPNLQSAHIFLESDHIFVDESVKHESLQDLVLDFYRRNVEWNDLKRLLTKYPNLKHLTLWHNDRLENAHVEQLVRILPNLVLFVIRDSDGVTQKADDYVQNFCKSNRRSIKFYFDENFREIHSDWPQLSTKGEKMSLGFDFVQNCFLKHFLLLSTFLIPIDESH